MLLQNKKPEPVPSVKVSPLSQWDCGTTQLNQPFCSGQVKIYSTSVLHWLLNMSCDSVINQSKVQNKFRLSSVVTNLALCSTYHNASRFILNQTR